jgi:hypothetical protein
MTNDRPDLPPEGAPVIDKTILVNVNRNKYQVVRPSWALKPELTDRLVVGRKVTLTLTLRPDLSSEGAPVIDKTILVNENRNKYPVVRPSWAFKPGHTDRLVVGRKVTLTLT